jgi:hypothetical protein
MPELKGSLSGGVLDAPRRVNCPEHGVVVEHIPWGAGKRPVTPPMMGFLALCARRLSWKETVPVFRTSWEAVYRSVEWFVRKGLPVTTHTANANADRFLIV